jgi:WD40 repeat protein
LGVSDLSVSKQKANELATASFDSTVKIYDIDKFEVTHTLTNHQKGVWTCDYSSNAVLATGSNDNSIILWDTRDYKSFMELKYHNEVVYDVKFSLNGDFLASCSKGMICLWDARNLGKPLSTIKGMLFFNKLKMNIMNMSTRLTSLIQINI